jgi:hypothetical protein
MGYMAHHGLMAIVYDFVMQGMYGHTPPDWEGFKESVPPAYRPLLVGPVHSIVNGYTMFAMFPDGSKEGWPQSDTGDEIRARFAMLFDDEACDLVEFRWGGDEPDMLWIQDVHERIKRGADDT